MEPLIELIRQIDGANFQTLMEICEKIGDMTDHDDFQCLTIDKLYICVSLGGSYSAWVNNENDYAELLVVYENKIMKLICYKTPDTKIIIKWYSATYEIIEKIIDFSDVYLDNFIPQLIEHTDVDTSWLFATTPIKSAH